MIDLEINTIYGACFPNYGRIMPRWIVMHYTGCEGGPRAICKAHARGTDKSTNFVVGLQDGTAQIWQELPAGIWAYHVGRGEVTQPKSSVYTSLDDMCKFSDEKCKSWRYDIAAKNHLRWISEGRDFKGNREAIGVDICTHNVDWQCQSASGFGWRFDDEAVELAAKLVAHLSKKYEIPFDRIIRHGDATGKLCPRPFMPTPFDPPDLKCEERWQDFKRRVIILSNERFHESYITNR